MLQIQRGKGTQELPPPQYVVMFLIKLPLCLNATPQSHTGNSLAFLVCG